MLGMPELVPVGYPKRVIVMGWVSASTNAGSF
jgi:hypothetical protein